jgi:hypothetical protein
MRRKGVYRLPVVCPRDRVIGLLGVDDPGLKNSHWRCPDARDG